MKKPELTDVGWLGPRDEMDRASHHFGKCSLCHEIICVEKAVTDTPSTQPETDERLYERGNAARFHDGEVHPRDGVYRGLHNHWPGRLARGLSVFQPRGGDLIQNVCTSTVLTIGHSTRTWKVFLDLLRAHRVERVIDGRSIPRSRHNPQFNQETLRTKLRSARIGYVHLGKLGGLRLGGHTFFGRVIFTRGLTK
jgi:Protein of unknown function, DUF488